MLLGEDLLLPLQSAASLYDRVEEGHLKARRFRVSQLSPAVVFPYLVMRRWAEPHLGQQQPLWLQLQLDLVPLVVQELLQLQVLQGAQRAIISPVHGYLHLPGLKPGHDKFRGKKKLTKQKPPYSYTFPACLWQSLTRSSSTVKVWSQACSPTVLQGVWPTTVFSSFSTALTSAADEAGKQKHFEFF